MKKTIAITPKHILLALITVLVWGFNFIAIHLGLEVIPPFLFCAMRFGFAALPWVFFLPKPKAPLKYIIGYGVFTFAFQFGFLFTGIHLGLTPGLSSLVLQISVFFSMGLAAFLFNDKPNLWKICGSLISFIGVGIVASHVDAGSTFIGFIMTLLAAFSWSVGNMFTKKVAADSPLSLVVWGNFVAFPIMAIVSYFVEGPTLIMASLNKVSLLTILAVVYVVYFSTHIGYGIWGFLLKTYSTAVVVPFTLLIPIVTFLSAAVFLGEDFLLWKLLASVFVISGLVFNLLEKKIQNLLATMFKKENYRFASKEKQ